MKLVEEITGTIFCDLEVGRGFLVRIQKSEITKETKTHISSKMTLNKVKPQSPSWKNIQDTYLTKDGQKISGRGWGRGNYEQNILHKNLIKDRRLEYIIHLEY